MKKRTVINVIAWAIMLTGFFTAIVSEVYWISFIGIFASISTGILLLDYNSTPEGRI